jgi:hypothetical protein
VLGGDSVSYYDGTKLLSLLDINGNRPEIYMVTTNRTGGKTTWFSSFLVRKFIKKQEKFMLLYRYNYELSDCAEKFFKDIHNLYFNDYNLKSQCRAKGMFHELFLNDESCGYAVALNNADTLKKYSHLFNDVERMFFDEFQSEMNKYCTDEIRKLLSIHTSVARGRGKQVRYVPVYMCGNTVSLLNPYYTAMGISDRLMNDTKFLKGDGFVLEQGFIESASKAQLESGFNRAFSSSDYVAYAAQNVYLNDNYSFIDKPAGRGRYLATVKYLNKHYAIYDYDSLGILYVTDSYDSSFPYRLSLTTDDHNINYLMLSKNSLMINNYRLLFNRGCFRFKNLDSKQMLLKLLSY